MGNRPFSNSLIERGASATGIEEGRIFNVNMRRWTADVRTATTQKTHLDIPWSNPYFHFTGGEGIFFMPEVGAKCMVCSPGDETPFILCFTTPHERPDAQEDDGSSALDGTTGEDEDQPRSNVTFKAGRPDLQQGDIMIRTRDGNGVWFRRGGVVEIGSNPITKRVFIPLLNYIRDFCENYELSTAGGRLSWNVARSDENAAGEAAAVLGIMSRDMAQHEFGTVAVQIGHIDDSAKLRVVVAPQAVNPNNLTVESGSVFSFVVDGGGNVSLDAGNDLNVNVGGAANVTVTGAATHTYSGGLTEEVTGDRAITISGGHTVEAATSDETISAGKTIDAATIKLGGGAVNHLIMAEPFIPWIVGHVHSHPMGPTGPPTAPPFDKGIMTTKVTGE